MAYRTQYSPYTRFSSLSTDQLLWGLAIITFGIGDVVTTAVFITAEMNHEGNPLVASALYTYGLWILMPWKIAVFGIFAAIYRLVPSQISVGVPIGLTLVGTALTVWNIYSSFTGARIVL